MTLSSYLPNPWRWALASFPPPETFYRRGKGGRFERAN